LAKTGEREILNLSLKKDETKARKYAYVDLAVGPSYWNKNSLSPGTRAGHFHFQRGIYSRIPNSWGHYIVTSWEH
jgi:hypothetical protein